MRIIYIDSDNHCHSINDNTMISIETDFFDGKCDAFVEGYCIELDDNNNIQKVYPWKPYSDLDDVQREYEKQLLLQYKAQSEEYAEALKILEVEI